MNQLIVDRSIEIDQGDRDGDVEIIQTVAFCPNICPQKLNAHKHRQLNRSKNLIDGASTKLVFQYKYLSQQLDKASSRANNILVNPCNVMIQWLNSAQKQQIIFS